ncbi:DgyrCDS1910 [Dimorphilus gyrociliatus]|uniref:DgyrCDS1910 n=1 Tax=Dimorphilus gyrociliatus TaxID=2664684 RepID=A0A7I8VBI6_9ANNE|nr:DgyrCDS1910 [Dimorphilus gyrociliatus]
MKTLILLVIILQINVAFLNSTQDASQRNTTYREYTGECGVEVIDANVYGRIKELVAMRIKLLVYDFSFPNASADPFRTSDHYFKPNKFYRAFQKHGQTLLALAFNYGILSVFTLELGVITERIELRDVPSGCFAEISGPKKMDILLDAIFHGFEKGENAHIQIEPFERVCHEIIMTSSIYADFEDRCCHWDAQKKKITCSKDIYNFWVKLLNVLLLILKVLVFVFGPLMIPRWLYTSQPHRVRYLVKLKEPLVKFITVANPGNVERYVARSKKIIDLTSVERGFPTCKLELKNFTPGDRIRVKISSYRLLINYGKLLLENKVPVGLFKVLKRAICLCKLKEISPFNDCCDSPILPVKQIKDIKWIHFCKLLTRIMLILLLPLPYYIRITLFYMYESEEIDARFKATDKLGKTIRFNFRFMHSLGPTHGLFIGIYIVYIFTACFLAYSHQRGKDSHFQRVMIKSFRELRNSVWLSSLKFLTFNILYPMRKFGLLGIIVGLIYWPFAIPFSLLVCVIYCLPLFYLIFRMLRYARDASTLKEDDDDEILFMADKQRINKKLEEEMEKLKTGSLLREFKQRRKSKADSKINLHKISSENLGDKKKVKDKDEEKCKDKETEKDNDKEKDVDKEKETDKEVTKDRLIQQDSIGTFSSFESEETDQMLKQQQSEMESSAKKTNRDKIKFIVLRAWQNLVGLMCIIAMAAVMMLMAECVGYMVEMFVFTLMGIIVNAGAVLRYVTLSLLVILYSYDCYNNVAKQYLKLNQAMFAEVKDRIHGISEVTSLPSYLQENMGFKAQEASDQAEHENPDDIASGEDGEALLPQNIFWDLNDLILFIDSDDVPRVPRKLFEELCEIRVSGSPGPVYLSLLAATKRFLIIVIFLLFVLIVVMSFGEIYQVSSTNQMLATFAGGFLPLMLRKVLQPIAPEPELKSLTFKSKMDEIIKNYHQLWPMFDLPLEPYPEEEDEKDKDSENEGGSDQPDGCSSRLKQMRNDFKKAVSFSFDKQSDQFKIEMDEGPEKDIDILFVIPSELDPNRNSWGPRSKSDFRRKAIRKDIPSSPTNRKSLNALQRMTSIGNFIKDNLDV